MSSMPPILVIIHYPVDVGFAIGRLVRVFYEMALHYTGTPSKIHFSFTNLKQGACEALPADFRNYLQFEPRSSFSATIATLTRYVSEHRIGVLFGMDMPVQAPYLAAARAAGIRAVVSYYGAPLSSVVPLPLRLLRRLEVRLFRRHRPDLFIVESAAMYRTAVDGRGIPKNQVRIVRNGVPLHRFTPSRDRVEFVYDHFSIPRHRKIVVFMGHFHQRKGVHVLLKAAIQIVNVMARDDLHFLFLGTRPEDVERVRAAVNYSAIEAFICLGGYQEAVSDLLVGCSIGCIPTTGWDSFPLSPLEMQACGLPVIVSDCQGLPETILDGVTGIVVPAGNQARLAEAIILLADDEKLRIKMGSAGRHRIETELTTEVQVAKLAKAVKDTVGASI